MNKTQHISKDDDAEKETDKSENSERSVEKI